MSFPWIRTEHKKEVTSVAAEANSDRAKPSDREVRVLELSETDKIECPSFTDEPWKSRAEHLRPKSLDAYVTVDLTKPLPPPLPQDHAYVRLYLRFLDTVPDACWVDEENDVD